MSTDDVKLWHIHFAPYCRHAMPQPKPKLIVAVGIENYDVLGFLINTNIRQYIKQRPHLLVCEATILASQHGCLNRDSFVDCTSLYRFGAHELQGDRGTVSHDGVVSILNAVRDCATIKARHKELILANGDGYLNDT